MTHYCGGEKTSVAKLSGQQPERILHQILVACLRRREDELLNSHKRTNLVSDHLSSGQNRRRRQFARRNILSEEKKKQFQGCTMHIVMRFKGVRKLFLEISDGRHILGAAYFGPSLLHSSPLGVAPVLPYTRWAVFIPLKCFPWSLTKITGHSKHPITSLQYEYHRMFTQLTMKFSFQSK